MGAKLQALLELQNIELQIVDIRRQIQQKERQVAAHRKKLEMAESAEEVEKAEIRRSQMAFDELDSEIKGRSSHIDKLRENLNLVKTNKEYAAVLDQLNNSKADLKRIEERAMQLMSELEQRKAALSDRQRGHASERERLSELQAQLEQVRGSYSARLTQLEKQREAAAGAIDAATRTLFDQLVERYDGEAMAEVLKPNARRDEYICGACQMGLRVEHANALAVRDDIRRCESCGRILYLSK